MIRSCCGLVKSNRCRREDVKLTRIGHVIHQIRDVYDLYYNEDLVNTPT